MKKLNDERLLLALPSDLKEQVAVTAKAKGLSANAYIRQLLEAAVMPTCTV